MTATHGVKEASLKTLVWNLKDEKQREMTSWGKNGFPGEAQQLQRPWGGSMLRCPWDSRGAGMAGVGCTRKSGKRRLSEAFFFSVKVAWQGSHGRVLSRIIW
jgi:hypothetical protein